MRIILKTTAGSLRWHATIMIVVIVTALVGAILIRVRTPAYVAAVEVIVTPGRSVGTSAEDQLAAAAGLLRSRAISRAVAASMDAKRRSPVTARTIDSLQAGLSVTRIERTYLLRIAYSADDPRVAATVANRYAALLAHLPSTIALPGAPVVRTISSADPPPTPQGAPTSLLLSSWLLACAAAGAGLHVLYRKRSAGVTSGSDLQARLGLSVLGSVPLLRSVLPEAATPLDAVVRSPLSGFTEAFRSVLVSTFQVAGRDARIVAITSALPDEGKSTVAACLARTAALDGSRVLLIDCDARRSAVSAMFAGRREGPPALSTCFVGNARWRKC